MHNFNDMMGVPDGIRQKTSHEMSVFMSWGDPEVTGSTTEEKLGPDAGGADLHARAGPADGRRAAENPTEPLRPIFAGSKRRSRLAPTPLRSWRRSTRHTMRRRLLVRS
jgi:hypothetical protein